METGSASAPFSDDGVQVISTGARHGDFMALDVIEQRLEHSSFVSRLAECR